jgi:hypothetical protein
MGIRYGLLDCWPKKDEENLHRVLTMARIHSQLWITRCILGIWPRGLNRLFGFSA